MTEKIDLTNRDISPEELTQCKELAHRLREAAPGDVVVEKLAKSLELGYKDAAKRFYESQLDKFRQTPEEAIHTIKKDLLGLE